MRRLFACGFAVTVALCTVVFAQTTGQTPAEPQTAPPAAQTTPQVEGKAPAQQVTVTGCVQPEADYRRARNRGRGGTLGTGAGVGNEYVLVSADPPPGAPAGTPGATGTTGGTIATGHEYELTGRNESQVGAFVGKRVEISGTLKAAEVGATGPTGGPTAGRPPTGVDVTSRDLKLRELEVTSVRETTGTCQADMPR